MARVFGTSVVAVADIKESRLKFAHQYASVEIYLIQPGQTGLPSKLGIKEGFDVVIEATGIQYCINDGVTALQRGGTFVQARLESSSMQFPIGLICDKEVNFKGSFRYGPGNYAIAIDLVRKGLSA